MRPERSGVRRWNNSSLVDSTPVSYVKTLIRSEHVSALPRRTSGVRREAAQECISGSERLSKIFAILLEPERLFADNRRVLEAILSGSSTRRQETSQ